MSTATEKFVLMALPQQGTETNEFSQHSKYYCVNGLTPTGDGNYNPMFSHSGENCVNGLTPTGDGNEHRVPGDAFQQEVLMALPQQGTETIFFTRTNAWKRFSSMC